MGLSEKDRIAVYKLLNILIKQIIIIKTILLTRMQKKNYYAS